MKSKWGLALSGGGVPGIFAHLGVMEALQEAGIDPPVVVGASAGGIVTALAAGGVPFDMQYQAWERLAKHHWSLIPRELLSFAELFRQMPNPGLLSLSTAIRAVAGSVPDGVGQRFLQSKVSEWPEGCGVVASDLQTGTSVVINKGGPWPGMDSWVAATATAALPAVFQGVRMQDGSLLQDGGMFADDPVQACRVLGATKVCLVRIGSTPVLPAELSWYELLRLAVARELHWADRTETADAVVDVEVSGGLLEFGDCEEDHLSGHEMGQEVVTTVRSWESAEGT